MKPDFKYYKGPFTEIYEYSENKKCKICRKIGDCTKQRDKSGYYCLECLSNKKFKIIHETEIGWIKDNELYKINEKTYDFEKIEIPLDFKKESFLELAFTPEFNVWQNCIYRVHCNDIMKYIGTWEPSDFEKHAPGHAKELFIEMSPKGFEWIWDQKEYENSTSYWPSEIMYYAFQCLHCRKYLGYWDGT